MQTKGGKSKMKRNIVPDTPTAIYITAVFYTIVSSFLQGLISVYGLALWPIFYPAISALTAMVLSAGFTVWLGIESDPLLILFFGVVNLFRGRLKTSTGSWAPAGYTLLNFILAIGASALGGYTYYAIFTPALPVALLPQNLTGKNAFFPILISTFIYMAYLHVTVLTNVNSRDAYSAVYFKGISQLIGGYILFGITRNVPNFASAIAVLVAGASTPDGWWIWIVCGLLGMLFTFAGYAIVLHSYVTNMRKKGYETGGNPMLRTWLSDSLKNGGYENVDGDKNV